MLNFSVSVYCEQNMVSSDLIVLSDDDRLMILRHDREKLSKNMAYSLFDQLLQLIDVMYLSP